VDVNRRCVLLVFPVETEAQKLKSRLALQGQAAKLLRVRPAALRVAA
jgi:hypothetical protein